MTRGIPRRWRRRIGLVTLVVALFLPGRAARAGDEIRVRYRSADTVYLSGGSAAGLAEGDRLELSRDGERVALVEIIFAAEHSASCRIVSESTTIQPNDLARLLPGEASGTETGGAEAGGGQQMVEAKAAEEAPAEPILHQAPEAPPEAEKQPKTTTVRGSLTLDHESLRDDSAAGLDYTRSTGRLKLRVRDIGGMPLEFRLRLRAQEYERDRDLTTGASRSESRDRLYEAVAVYEPPNGRYSFRLGRISSNPFVGIGFFDGVLGGVRLGRRVTVGGFFGSRAVIGESAFESKGQKYGIFSRFSSGEETGRKAFELVTAAVREEGDLDVSREYVTIQTRYTPTARWSFYQRAEIDFNRGWREELSGDSSQVSFLSVTAIARLSESSRFSLSYDQSQRYRTEETRSISEELFDDLMRQGFRARLSFGKPRGFNFSLMAGLRQRDDDDDDTTTFGGSVYHSRLPWNLSFSANVLSFTNRLSDGYVASVRGARRFSGGHEIDISAGLRDSTSRLFDDDTLTTHWVRLGGWYELPGNLYLRGDYEIGGGDELDSQRLTLGLGFRF